MARPIHIIGGGLAGLTLGIGLRKRQIPVTISESGNYPRHRVCGEFISGRGAELLQRLAGGNLAESAPRIAHSAAFYVRDRCLGIQRLPKPALCISRYSLDALLARKFVQMGGELLCGQRIPPSSSGGYDVGTVIASGRRRETIDGNGWRWFGLKAHFRNVQLATDLEMHVDADAYVGMCRLQDGIVNVCGLFRRRGQGDGRSFDPLTALRGGPTSILNSRLSQAEPDEASVCAVAGLNLAGMHPPGAEFRIGDAWAMIPPVTGNGMSMAFESATMALEPLEGYSHGNMDWPSTVSKFGRIVKHAFRRRLRWASVLHAGLFSISRNPVWGVPIYRMAWGAGFALTR